MGGLKIKGLLDMATSDPLLQPIYIHEDAIEELEPLGAPGCLRGRPIRTSDSIFSSPPWMSFLSWGIWVARSLRAAVRAGLGRVYCIIITITIITGCSSSSSSSSSRN